MLALMSKALPGGLPAPRLQRVGESDWAEAWKEHFHVIRIGRQFVIKPSWRDYDPLPGDLVIEIDPGLAFGSGLHPTTRLCMEILEDLQPQGHSLFDVGTGSGVLAIAALKLGARQVRAVDVDDVAVRVARENFERNGYPLPRPVSGEGSVYVEAEEGSAGDSGGRQWDLVVANILAHVLAELMPLMVAALAPGGRLILSGIVAEQEAVVTAALEIHRLRLAERRTDEDWVALVAERAVR
jgi:ribosomal protein L11 methyltransferase